MQTKTLLRLVTLSLGILLVTGCSKEAKKARLLSEANNYFKAGDYDKAKVTYLNVIRLDPQNALAFERIGAIWQDDAAPLRAAAFLEKAIELDPKNVQNRVRLARCHVTTARFDQAQKEALKVLEQSPANGEALVILTEAARSKEELLSAEDQLQKFPNKNDVSYYLASANLFFSEGNTRAADEALRHAIKADPKSSQAHMALANLFLLQKDSKQAGEEFNKAADLAPVRSIERLKYAAFKSTTGDIDEVKKIATEMTKKAPDYPAGWTLLAEVAFKAKKYDDALSLLENVFSRDPDYVDGRRLQGNVLLAKGDNKKAIEILERLDQTYPDSPMIKYQLAGAYFRNNNVSQATVALDQAISINPNYTDAVLLLGQINVATGHGEKAIESLSRLLERKPHLKSAVLLLAAAYGWADRLDEAITVLENETTATPDDAQLQIALGAAYSKAKKNDKARQAFEKAAQLAPDDFSIVQRLLELDLLEKHFDAARQRVRQFEKTPDSPAAHYFEGKILAAEGKWDATERELHKALQLDPNFVAACDLLVQSYLAANKVPQAINELQAQLTKAPNAQSLLTLALLYERTGNFPQARDVYEKLLAINPNFVLALNNLAYLYTERLDNPDKAYELARKARDMQPQDPTIMDTLGWVLYKRGDYQQALSLLQESAEKLPDNPEIQFHLGMTAYMMDQKDTAKVAFKKAASTAKDFPSKGENNRRLAMLETGNGLSPELPVAQLEAIAKQQQNDPVSQMRLGEAYQKQGSPDKAAIAFEQALKINPRLVDAATKLAQLNAGPLHNKEKALAYAKKARELAPDDPRIAAFLGEVAYQSSNFTWSYSLLHEAARQRQNDPAVLYDLAWSAYSLGKVNEARDAMQNASASKPEFVQKADAVKFLTFTALDENSKELTGAESDIQKELKSNPEYIPALMAHAALLAQRGDVKPATDIYSGILRRWPEFAPAQKRLAAVYAQDPSTVAPAYDLATKARKTLPEDPELAELLGQLSYEKKEYPRAVQLLQESARKRPLDANCLFYLGMSQLQARQKTEARGVLNQALTDGLQEPFATEAKRALADLNRE